MKKHLKSNMTIIGIIRVFKRAPRGLLKDPADDGSAGSLLAGILIESEPATNNNIVATQPMRSQLWLGQMMDRADYGLCRDEVAALLGDESASKENKVGGVLRALRMLFKRSPRFNMYGNEFGMGKGVAVRSGYANKFDGKVKSYSGHKGGGSIDLELCLSPDTMSALESDEEFMSAVC
ncbi:hypothetical protein D0Y65_008891 [Glycine soja]|uniref:BAHD acyltransferase DCR n=1 Tax=Glycine soja TaxID=3848 RepID=A0A445KWF0_GLYSO|nr:hypothetical protein D0Y65_008891 [Glycine soja]